MGSKIALLDKNSTPHKRSESQRLTDEFSRLQLLFLEFGIILKALFFLHNAAELLSNSKCDESGAWVYGGILRNRFCSLLKKNPRST